MTDLRTRLEDMRDFCSGATGDRRPHPNNVANLCQAVLEQMDARERRVGQAIADGHDAFIIEATRPISKNPAMISDDAWLVAVGRAAIKAVEDPFS